MKKLIAALCVLCVLAAGCIAIAETQESWNEGSEWRLNEAADVWTIPSEALSAAPDLTLPKGTWVRVVSDDGTWTIIDYFAGGTVRSGAVLSRQVIPATGVATPVPAPTATPIPLATAIPSAVNPTPSPVPPSPALSGMLSPVAEATSAPEPSSAVLTKGPIWVSISPDSALQQAQVITLGSCTTLVKYDGQELSISTAEIICSDTVQAGHQVAVITAPKGGYASLRRDATPKGELLLKVKDGTLVCVLEEGPEFCLIWADNYRGYVTTGVLNFDVIMDEPIGTALLCGSNGKTTGNGTVNVRVAMKKNATKSADWAIGSQVTLLKKQGDWYLAEQNGQRGYVYHTFIKVQ